MAQKCFSNPWVALYQEKNLFYQLFSALPDYVFLRLHYFLKLEYSRYLVRFLAIPQNIAGFNLYLYSDLNLRIFFLRFVTIFLLFWLLKTKFCVFEQSSAAQNEFTMRVKGLLYSVWSSRERLPKIKTIRYMSTSTGIISYCHDCKTTGKHLRGHKQFLAWGGNHFWLRAKKSAAGFFEMIRPPFTDINSQWMVQ